MKQGENSPLQFCCCSSNQNSIETLRRNIDMCLVCQPYKENMRFELFVKTQKQEDPWH